MTDTPELRPMGKGEASPLLIDDIMPNRHASRVEMLVVEADPGPTYAALRELDFMSVHSPLMDAATWARRLPERIAVATGRREPTPPPPAMRLSEMFDRAPGERPPDDAMASIAQSRARVRQRHVRHDHVPVEVGRAFRRGRRGVASRFRRRDGAPGCETAERPPKSAADWAAPVCVPRSAWPRRVCPLPTLRKCSPPAAIPLRRRAASAPHSGTWVKMIGAGTCTTP